jgi:hypothetical protein
MTERWILFLLVVATILLGIVVGWWLFVVLT